MDADDLKALFAPIGPVSVKRMFGGHGVYADGLCFALEHDGEIYFKADDAAKAVYAEAGSAPFVHTSKGKPMTMAYWRLVASAYDDEDELKRWAELARRAARLAAAAKATAARAKGPAMKSKKSSARGRANPPPARA